jgi:hypothetical protein
VNIKKRAYLYRNEDGTPHFTFEPTEELELMAITVAVFNNKLGEWVDGRKQIEPLEKVGNDG